MSSTTCSVEVSVAGNGVARVEMARADLFNAFDEAMIGQLDAAYERLAADAAVRAIVLAGRGKAFSAGADLQWMQRASQATQAWNLDDARRLAAMLARIAACPQPTMARVHGLALGGGVGLACACDIVLAADDARFGLPEARFGILPAVIGPYLVNAIGARQAQRLALTARRIDAHEARRLGLAHEVHPASQLDAAVDAVLAELLANGPQAQREVKALFSQLQPGPVTPEVREYTAQAISRVRIGDEAREGYAAFFGKRTPRWQGGAG